MEAQHSLEWYRKRLGKVTGSRVGDLMNPVEGKRICSEIPQNPIYINWLLKEA